MIDNEADFGNILDATEEVQTAAKFRPKQRAKPRKTTLQSRSAAPDPTVENRDGKGALTRGNSSEVLISQERESLTYPGSKTADDIAGSQGILDTPSEDVMTVPLGHLDNHGVTWGSATCGASAVDMVSQDDDHGDGSSKLATQQTHQESLVVSDIHVSPASSCGKTIDDIVDIGEMFDAQAKEERAAKFQPKVQVKLLKAATKSRRTSQKAEASTVDAVTQNGRGDNNQTGLDDDQLQHPRYHESGKTSYSEALLESENITVGNLANLDSILEEPVQEETIAKFRPKLRPKPGKASSSKVAGTNDNVAAAPMVGLCADNNDMSTKPKDQESIPGPPTWSPQDVHATIDLDYRNDLINRPDDGSQSMVGDVSAEPTFKSQPNGGREKGKGKSVSFALPDASEGIAPTDANSEMGTFSDSCNDKLTDENLNTSRQQISEKEYTDNECQYHEEEPSDHAVEQQPKSDDGEIGSSMKLRSRKELQKVGIPKHSFDDFWDEDCVEHSVAEQDNDSGDNYTANVKRKVRRKSRDGIEESQQQNVRKDKSQVSSRGRKRTLNDASTEKPEKKLTHRIRQKRMKEVKTLLDTPNNEIDRMKLTATHLRLLQEARERVNGKQNPSGPSANASSQLEDPDEEAENFDNDRTETDVQNATKLNYHSYMNKQTRAKWSKSDTDLFYQALRQFGSDFAMIQQLFPDKTRHQVRQKFKTEEKKNPMQVHDAIIHRTGDNLYFKKVIKQLNIDDVLPEISNTHKQDGASHEGHPGNENALDDFINEEEENGTNLLDKEHDMHMSDAQEEEHVSGNDDDDDDLGAVFDWY